MENSQICHLCDTQWDEGIGECTNKDCKTKLKDIMETKALKRVIADLEKKGDKAIQEQAEEKLHDLFDEVRVIIEGLEGELKVYEREADRFTRNVNTTIDSLIEHRGYINEIGEALFKDNK